MNGQVPVERPGFLTMDTIHLLVTGLASIVFALIFIFIPPGIPILAQQPSGAIANGHQAGYSIANTAQFLPWR